MLKWRLHSFQPCQMSIAVSTWMATLVIAGFLSTALGHRSVLHTGSAELASCMEPRQSARFLTGLSAAGACCHMCMRM